MLDAPVHDHRISKLRNIRTLVRIRRKPCQSDLKSSKNVTRPRLEMKTCADVPHLQLEGAPPHSRNITQPKKTGVKVPCSCSNWISQSRYLWPIGLPGSCVVGGTGSDHSNAALFLPLIETGDTVRSVGLVGYLQTYRKRHSCRVGRRLLTLRSRSLLSPPGKHRPSSVWDASMLAASMSQHQEPASSTAASNYG